MTDAINGGRQAGPASSDSVDSRTRARLALIFVLGGTAAIMAMAIIDVWHPGNTVADKVFTAILGVAGTWVSTILVFYFSRENFQAAQSTLSAAVVAAQSGSRPRVDSSLSAAMTPLDKLTPLPLSGADPEASLPLSKLCSILSAQEESVPILIDGAAKYMVHNSSLFRFIADRSMAGQPVIMTAGADATTFKEMTAFAIQNGPNKGRTFGDVLSTFITLPLSATVNTAKTELLKASGVQDIVVTQDGSPGGQMLGLLTSEAIAQMVMA